MPAVDVVYFRDLDGTAPVLKWIEELARRDRRAAEKCIARIELLREQGHALRRPIADFLRDGIYELRVRAGSSQHRVLNFFPWAESRGAGPLPHQGETGAANRYRASDCTQASLPSKPSATHLSRGRRK